MIRDLVSQVLKYSRASKPMQIALTKPLSAIFIVSAHTMFDFRAMESGARDATPRFIKTRFLLSNMHGCLRGYGGVGLVFDYIICFGTGLHICSPPSALFLPAACTF